MRTLFTREVRRVLIRLAAVLVAVALTAWAYSIREARRRHAQAARQRAATEAEEADAEVADAERSVHRGFTMPTGPGARAAGRASARGIVDGVREISIGAEEIAATDDQLDAVRKAVESARREDRGP